MGDMAKRQEQDRMAGNSLYAENMAKQATKMDNDLKKYLNNTYQAQIANRKLKEQEEREQEKRMAQRAHDQEMQNDRKTGAIRKGQLEKYKEDIQDSIQYTNYMK